MTRLIAASIVVLLCLSGCHAEERDEASGREAASGSEYDDCKSGDLDACYAHAQRHEVGNAESRRSALVTYQYACLLGHGQSCGRLETFWGDETVTTARTRENLAKGCEAGELEACVTLASRLPDRTAVKIYSEACAAGSAAACEGEAVIVRKAYRFESNLVRAQELSEKACEGGYLPGCISAGGALLFGSGLPVDRERGLMLLEKTCTTEVGEGCEVLARVWSEGIGVEPDAERANHYWTLAESHVNEPAADDPASAYVVYVAACSFGDMLGCFNAAWFRADGAEVRRNITTSRELFERACKGGVARACERLREIRPTKPARSAQ